MSDENEEVVDQSPLGPFGRLQRLVSSYNPWAASDAVLSAEEQSNLEEDQKDAVTEFVAVLDQANEHAVDDADRDGLNNMKTAVSEMDSSPEGTKSCMDHLVALFSSLSEVLQRFLIEPLCKLFKAIGEACKNACRKVVDYKDSFFNKNEESGEEEEGLEHDDDNRPD